MIQSLVKTHSNQILNKISKFSVNNSEISNIFVSMQKQQRISIKKFEIVRIVTLDSNFFYRKFVKTKTFEISELLTENFKIWHSLSF